MVDTPVRSGIMLGTTFFGVFVVFILGFFTVGPIVEEKLLPPLFSEVKASFVQVNDQEAQILFTGIKTRSCYLIAARAEVWKRGIKFDGTVTMLDQEGQILDKERQRIALGERFVRRARVIPGGEGFRVYIESRCHPLWVSSQHLLDIDVGGGKLITR